MLYTDTQKTNVVERPDNYDFEVGGESLDHQLRPFQIFTDSTRQERSCLLFLNTPVQSMDLKVFWSRTQLHICADGAANHLYEYFNSHPEDRSRYIPDLIIGDFDSLKPEVAKYYSGLGTTVIKQETQWSTDFTKSAYATILYFAGPELRSKLLKGDVDGYDGLGELAHQLLETPGLSDIRMYALGGIGGRFDQTISSVAQLYKLKNTFNHLHTFFISDSDIIFLLRKGKTLIQYANKQSFNVSDTAPKCGLLPFGRETILSSQGLKYDMTNWKSSIQGNMSTSNGVAGTKGFSVQTSDDIVMTIEVSFK